MNRISTSSFKFFFTLPFVLIISLGVTINAFGKEIPIAKKGILDLRGWNFSEQPAINLEGEWEFYWKEYLSLEDIESRQESKVYRQFPKLWQNDSVGGNLITPEGYATHRLKVILSSITPELSISIPQLYSSYFLFINGDFVTSNGHVGVSKETSLPHWQPQTNDLRVTSDTLDIILQIANFRHSKGGASKNLAIGTKDFLQSVNKRTQAFDLIMGSSLFFIGLFFMVLYWFGRHEKQILYFSLFSLFYSYRSIGSDTYTLHYLVPDIPWILTLRLEYITMYLSAVFFVFYSYHLYKAETSRLFVKVSLGLGVTLIIISLFFPPSVFTNFATPYSIYVLLSFIYLFYTYVLATAYHRIGSKLSLVSTLFLFLTISHTILAYLGITEPVRTLYFIGFQQFFFFQSIILFYRYTLNLELAKKKAERAAQSRSDFLSMISHEIRTPLNAVIGLTNYLISDKPKEGHVEDLRTLKFSAEHLHVLINDVLDYSKLDAGKIEFEMRDVNIRQLAENIIRAFESKAIEKGIYLKLNFDDKIPNRIITDGLRLSQILTNLIGNAIKFTSTGGVTLSLLRVTSSMRKVAIKFLVEDTGIGIPKDKQSSIFDSFSQASSSTTREFGGTGLGLAITKRILDLQNIKINLFSQESKGSRFYFTQAFEISEIQVLPSATEVEEKVDLAGKNVLLVEDNPVNVMVAKRFLSKWKINVDVAENGREAIEKTASSKYDLILMDLQMPVMDGYDASSELRKQGLKTPIVALTASVMLDVGDKVFSCGMNDYITKPFDPDDLYNKIKLQMG
ncbi:response regulator [Reichenbachiella sp. MALMAid0571]|uniref:response regulator n=1 Tax=Reichenbachiella sp. MALMAid0571 TaxID=3143939 RepID=UPI0032DF1919